MLQGVLQNTFFCVIYLKVDGVDIDGFETLELGRDLHRLDVQQLFHYYQTVDSISICSLHDLYKYMLVSLFHVPGEVHKK